MVNTTAAAHLSKIISEAKFPAPCQTQGACDALAAHLIERFNLLDPVHKQIEEILFISAPADLSIRDL